MPKQKTISVLEVLVVTFSNFKLLLSQATEISGLLTLRGPEGSYPSLNILQFVVN